MGKRRRMLEADDIAVALKVSKEKYHGQDPQPAITYPDGEYIRGSQSIKSIGTRLAKLLLSFYKKRPHRMLGVLILKKIIKFGIRKKNLAKGKGSKNL